MKHLSSGGVITHMMTLAEGLTEAGWTVAVCSRGRVGTHPRGPDWFEARGIPHFTVGFPRTGKVADTLLHAPRALVQMAAAVRSFSPDLVHVHFRSVSPFARAIEATYGIPFVSTLHAGIRSDPLSRIASFWGTRAIAVSSDTCESLQRAFRIPSHKVRLVYNGADAGHFRPPTELERAAARQALSIPAGVRVISMVGRLAPEKGHEVLFRALRALGPDRKVLVLVAGGSDTRAVAQLAREADVEERVRFLGQLIDTRRVLWASDVSVLPSLHEGFGLVTVEAMLCGVVPVRTPAGGAVDQIEDGVNGFIIPFHDAAALADRLARLFDDDVTRHRMAAAALARGRERFTTRHMTARTIEIYEETLMRRPLRARGNAG